MASRETRDALPGVVGKLQGEGNAVAPGIAHDAHLPDPAVEEEPIAADGNVGTLPRRNVVDAGRVGSDGAKLEA
ncbi:MAG TPA: hypothetical protein VGL81_03870 [Polyangiaceae bacterium]